MKGVALAGSVLLLAAMISLPRPAFGNGFDIYEQGAKAVGMAGAFTAQADDPSALFYNPAGITQLDGTQASVGLCPINPTMAFKSDGNALMGTSPGQRSRIRDHTWTIPNAFVTSKVHPKVSLGIGAFGHFGLGVEWPGNFEGRFSPGALKTVLKTISVSPVIALRPTERFSFAVGPYAQYFDIEMNNLAFIAAPVPPFTPDRNSAVTVRARLRARNWAWGWQSGFLYRLTGKLTFGAAYLSEVRHHVTDGTQELVRLSDGLTIRRQGASATMTLPATLRFGLALKTHPWTVEAGAQWTEWSRYRTLRADFADGTYLESPKRWHDVWQWRIGAQYTVNQYLDLRAGVLYDRTPIPRGTLDPLVPCGDRLYYALGVGLHYQAYTLDLGYNYVQDRNRRWNNPSGDVKVGPATVTRVTGTFENTSAHLLALNLTRRF